MVTAKNYAVTKVIHKLVITPFGYDYFSIFVSKKLA